MSEQSSTTNAHDSPFRLLVIVALAVFVSEALVMILLLILPPLPHVLAAPLDATLVTILIYPILRRFLVRPMTQHLNERRQAEAALRLIQDDLELRVQQRTTELAQANESLQVQVAERQRTGEELKVALDLVQRRQAEMAGLLTGARAVLEYRDFSQSARAIFEACRSTIGATTGYVALPTEDRSGEQPVFSNPGVQANGPDRMPLSMPMVGLRQRAYMTGKTAYTNESDGGEGTQWLPGGHLALNNILLAPLTIKGFVVGTLGLANKPGGFSGDDARLADAFAELAAIAVLNSQTIRLLESSEKRFRTLAQASFEGIVISEGGIVREANEQFAQMHGYTLSEVLDKPITNFLAPQDHARMRQAIANDGRHVGEYHARHKDGSEFPLEVRAYGLEQGGRAMRVAALRDITERKRAEEALRESEEQLRALYVSMTEGLANHEVVYRNGEAVDYIITDVNPAFERITGLTRNEVLGRKASELYGTGSPPYLEIYAKVAAGGSPENFESYFSPIKKHFTVSVFSPEAGKFAAVFTDITERKQAEELRERLLAEVEALARTLQAERDILDTIMENTAAHLAYLDRDFNFVRVNSAYAHGSGHHKEELLGCNHFERFPNSENQAIFEQVRDTCQPVAYYAEPFQFADQPERSITYWDWTLIPIKNPEGRALGVVLSRVDVTRRVQSEEALRQAHAELELRVLERTAELAAANKELRLQSAALQAAANGIIITDRQGNIQWSNPAFTQMTGYSLLEALGQNMRLLKSQEQSPEFYQRLWETILSGSVWHGELINRRKDGGLYVEEQTIAPVISDQDEIVNFVSVKQDVTERKRAETRLQQNNRNLLTLSEAERRARQVAETLSAANLALTQSLDLEIVMEVLLDYVYQLVPYDSANIMLLETEEHLMIRATRGYESWTDVQLVRAIAFDVRRNRIFRELIAMPKSVLIAETRVYPDWDVRPGTEHVRSWLGVPIVAGGNVIGVYSLDKVTPNFFTAEHIRLAEALVGQAAVAIQNARLYQAEQQARQTAETLRAASLALTQTLDLESVVNTLLDYVEQLIPYDAANVMVLEAKERLTIRAVRDYEQWADGDQVRRQTCDVSSIPIIQQLFDERRSLMIADGLAQPDRMQGLHLAPARSWLGVPLIAGGNVIGLYSLIKVEPNYFTLRHVQLAEALVGQAATAVQNAWLFEQVRQGREQLQDLSRRLVEVQESERRYIARELHDEAGQALTSLMVGLRLLERDAGQPEALKLGIAELNRLVDGVQENLHRLAVDLRPASLDYLGLVAALRQYVESFSDKHGLVVQFEAVGLGNERLPSEVETAVYRIVQEALTNVVRHAHATRVDVLLKRRGDRLAAIVEDNGIGFDVAQPQTGRLGLFGIRERAEMLGGTLLIESSEHHGTTLVAEVSCAS